MSALKFKLGNVITMRITSQMILRLVELRSDELVVSIPGVLIWSENAFIVIVNASLRQLHGRVVLREITFHFKPLPIIFCAFILYAHSSLQIIFNLLLNFGFSFKFVEQISILLINFDTFICSHFFVLVFYHVLFLQA